MEPSGASVQSRPSRRAGCTRRRSCAVGTDAFRTSLAASSRPLAKISVDNCAVVQNGYGTEVQGEATNPSDRQDRSERRQADRITRSDRTSRSRQLEERGMIADAN